MMRELDAASNRRERAERRRQRELERQSKLQARMAEHERAIYETQLFENRIDLLLSVHKECGNKFNWAAIQSAPLPQEPVCGHENEARAQIELDAFKLSFTDKLLSRGESKRNLQIKKLEEAKIQDEMAYRKSLEAHQQACFNINKLKEISGKIIAGDPKSYLEAINYVQPFSDMRELGSSIDFYIESSVLIKATLHVHEEEVVPSEIKSVTKSGKLSVNPMPKSKLFDIYQDYICGSVFRVARELFALLPIEMVIVTAMRNVLSSQTGHFEEKPILSVAIPRSKMDKLNFDNLDPSDALSNFIHNMVFKRGKGFSAVEPIDAPAMASNLEYRDPKKGIDLLEKVISLIKIGKYDESIESMDDFIRAYPQFAQVAWNVIGLSFQEQGKYEKAIMAYDEAIKLDPNLAEAWKNKGDALGIQGKFDEALQAYERAIEINPQDANTWSNKGVILYKQGKFDEALQAYEKAIEINPQDTDAWLKKGVALYDQGKFDEALQAYEKAIEINPQDKDAWFSKGNALKKLGKYDEAIQSYDKPLEIDPQYADAWFNKGVVLSKIGRHDEAIKAYDKVIYLKPEDAEAWNNKGDALKAQGKFDEAIQACSKAIEINPLYADAWNNQGTILQKLGTTTEANEAFAKAKELGYVNQS